CAHLREKLEEDLVSCLKYFQESFESSDDSTNVVNAPREPFVVKQDHGVKSSQNPPHIDKCCCECGNALDEIFCQQCICKSCGKGAHTGYNCPPKVPIISNPELCNQTINNELPQTLPSFDSVPCVSKPNFVDESSKIFNPPPQHHMYPCEFCGNDAYFGHYYTPQAQFNNLEQCYSQDFNFPQNIHNFQQQYFCCDQCGGPHETSQCQQCQPTNEDYCYEQNSCYYSNSFGSDHCQPPQYTVDHPIFDAHNDFLKTQNELLTSQNTIMEQMTQWTSMCETVCQFFQKKQEEKRIEEEQAANARYWKIPACCDDDDDYDFAITPILSTKEPINSLSMGDEHLDTIPATESDEVIKSSVENLIPTLSEFEGIPDTMRDYSGSTTTHCDISFLDYEAFYFDDDHIKEISSGSTTTHSDISLSEYDSFIFEEFVDELAHIISPSEYDCFYFKDLPNPNYFQRILSSKSQFPQLQLGIMYPNLID
nr:hypothetical protein [Tanacetum cinerariifolium]